MGEVVWTIKAIFLANLAKNLAPFAVKVKKHK